MSPEMQDKLTRWYQLRQQIAEFAPKVAEEQALRRELVALAFEKAPDRGTHRAPLGFGKELKVVAKTNYTVDREKLGDALQAGDLPEDVHDAVIKYTPEVREAVLLELQANRPELKLVLAEIITAKPGSPTVEIVDAK